MSPIEEHLNQRLRDALAQAGVPEASVVVLSAEAENWRYRVSIAGREFELGYNHAEQLWCRETTAGRERHLVSNDHPPVRTSSEAFARGVRLVALAIRRPTFAPRDPPVI